MGKKGKRGRKGRSCGALPAGDRATVTIDGQSLQLRRPRSYAIRVDIVGYRHINPSRAFAAALGVCLPHLQAPEASLDQVAYSVPAYGGLVLDELIERGWRLKEIMDAGEVAFGLLSGGLVTAREVKEAEGNSGAPAPSTD